MQRKKSDEYKRREDPYDPLTGATGNDDPNYPKDNSDEVETDGKESGG